MDVIETMSWVSSYFMEKEAIGLLRMKKLFRLQTTKNQLELSIRTSIRIWHDVAEVAMAEAGLPKYDSYVTNTPNEDTVDVSVVWNFGEYGI